ncbi:MAG: PhoH family protein [Spirochaetales bacterium]
MRLKKTSSIILENTGVLSELCGANDTNLEIIAEVLETPIFSRGNEIVLETDNLQVHRRFKQLIGELETYALQGQSPTPDLIRAVYASILTQNTQEIELLRNASINIPGGFCRVFPRGIHQARYIEGIQNHVLSFGIGPAGTGKTYLAVACALEEVISRKKRKLILTRPVVEAGESLGFLPGDLTQKLNPYLRPLYDAMESLVPHELLNRLQENGMIEIAPLAYMRGRSLKNCVVILDEAQNTTREQMKMFLTRMGEDSRVVVTGDITQIDLPKKEASGLIHAMKILREIREIYFVFFTPQDVVRHPLVKKIVQAYEAEGKE